MRSSIVGPGDMPGLRSGELCPTSLRAECLHELFGIFLHGRFAYYPSFIYLLNSYMKYNSIVLYFLAQTIPALAIGLCSLALCLFCISPSVCVCVHVTFSYFLALRDVPGSSHLFPTWVLESVISPRNSSFFGDMILETKFWALGMLVAIGISLL